LLIMRHVLIIDDEDDIREVAAESLETLAGWHVDTASSGEDGLRTAAFNPPDAVLLDVAMPAMDGPTTFREMQRSPDLAHIPVILLTAESTGTAKQDLAQRGLALRRFDQLGVAAVLFKPINPRTLADQMSAVLGWT
jgi:CheY-like chemotaxis protein